MDYYARTAARILYSNAIIPPIVKAIAISSDSVCWLCGYKYHTMYPIKKIIGLSFTDHSETECPESDVICAPCAWALSGRPPDTFRAWTIVYRKDKELLPSNPKVPNNRLCNLVHFTARDQLIEVLDVLINPPKDDFWFCSIALTGQMHTVPFTKINYGNSNWVIRADKMNIEGNPNLFGKILFHAAFLYNSGFNRSEILDICPYPGKVLNFGIERWKYHIEIINKWKRSNMLRIIEFFLNKKGIESVIEKTRRFV